VSTDKIQLFERVGADEDHFVMLCKDLKNLSKKENKDLKFPYWISRKYDGIFCIAHKVRRGLVEIGSRTGERYTSMKHIEQACDKIMATDTIMIFEAMIEKPQVLLEGETETSVTFEKLNKISGACRGSKQAPEIVAYVHDFLLYSEFCGLKTTPFAMRYSRVCLLHDVDHFEVVEQKYCPSLEAAKEMCKNILEIGGEGVVLTASASPYMFKGYRGLAKIKLKGTLSFDLRVLDVVEGKGKFKGTVGALRVEWFNDKTIDISGMCNAERDLWWLNKENIVGKIVEVEAMNKSPKGVLTQPRFKCIRFDKGDSDVDLNVDEGRIRCYEV